LCATGTKDGVRYENSIHKLHIFIQAKHSHIAGAQISLSSVTQSKAVPGGVAPFSFNLLIIVHYEFDIEKQIPSDEFCLQAHLQIWHQPKAFQSGLTAQENEFKSN
jgi:hypothetical protein